MTWTNDVEYLLLDFETWSPVDLREKGVHNYMRHPKTKALCAAFAIVTPAAPAPLVVSSQFLVFPETDLGQWGESGAWRFLFKQAEGRVLVAHNLEFELLLLQRKAALYNLPLKLEGILDTAALAQGCGLGRSLRQAAAMVGAKKLDEDGSLIKEFCTGPEKTYWEIVNHPRWEELNLYCRTDVEVMYDVMAALPCRSFDIESHRQLVALEMNDNGWPVDMDSVRSMKAMADINKEEAFHAFCRSYPGTPETFFGSSKQLKQFTRDRGIVMDSFDEQHVADMVEKLEARHLTSEDEKQVLDMLYAKKMLGGSGLRKLDVIERMVGDDNRLRGQYMHIGAGQSFRTTGVGVQMQNLKRLPPQPSDLPHFLKTWKESERRDARWTNDALGKNLRQLFNVEEPGRLIVGDFSSVESRGLAWMADAQWKLDAFFEGKDMYKVMASQIFHTPYDLIEKPQRQIGKVGELSCGYQAGRVAVKNYGAKMGIHLSDAEVSSLIKGWRNTNVEIVRLWADLDEALRRMVHPLDRGFSRSAKVIKPNVTFAFYAEPSLESIQAQHPGAVDITIQVEPEGMKPFARYLRGVYKLGDQLVYHKPSPAKGGPLWRDYFTSPQTKRVAKNTIYGGKLTGILTQSLCREIFMDRMVALQEELLAVPLLHGKLIGQFHDELVVEYCPKPGTKLGASSEQLAKVVKQVMSAGAPPGFPLATEVAMDRRYIK